MFSTTKASNSPLTTLARHTKHTLGGFAAACSGFPSDQVIIAVWPTHRGLPRLIVSTDKLPAFDHTSNYFFDRESFDEKTRQSFRHDWSCYFLKGHGQLFSELHKMPRSSDDDQLYVALPIYTCEKTEELDQNGQKLDGQCAFVWTGTLSTDRTFHETVVDQLSIAGVKFREGQCPERKGDTYSSSSGRTTENFIVHAKHLEPCQSKSSLPVDHIQLKSRGELSKVQFIVTGKKQELVDVFSRINHEFRAVSKKTNGFIGVKIVQMSIVFQLIKFSESIMSLKNY